jgi:regulatory protein
VTEPDPIELAARALGRRDHSRHEIDEKLTRAGVGAEARAESLATLERLGYVDDGRYAADRAAALAARGYGDAFIRYDLEGHGVDAESATLALAALQPEVERAHALALQPGSSPPAVARTVAKLARKGFSDESLEGIFATDADVA